MPESPIHAKNYRSMCRGVAARVAASLLLALVLISSSPHEARAQNAQATGMRISQIYTRGGEPGAAFQNDFIELFNAGGSDVDMNGWGMHIVLGQSPAPSSMFIRFASTRSLVVRPGGHVLIRLSGGANGEPLPTPDFDLASISLPIPLDLPAASGTVGLLMPDSSFMGCPPLSSPGVADFVGYGAGSTCFEGTDGPAPAPEPATAALREQDGCADNDSNKLDFLLGAPVPRNGSTPPAPCAEFAPPSFFNFESAQSTVPESQGSAEIKVVRTGDLTEAESVEYVVSGGTASERGDFTTVSGRLRFAPGETEKSFDVLLTDDATQELDENVRLVLWKPQGAGASVGILTPATSLVIQDNDTAPAPNPSENTAFFVRQHYHDFLNREPDDAGLAHWTQNIEACGADALCREVKRVDTSAAFFLSIEFQRTGFLVYKLYRASLPERDYRQRSVPRYAEFVRDTQELGRDVVVGEAGWEDKLKANTQTLLEDFMSRAEFALSYPQTLAPGEYVDKLNAQAGGVLSKAERDALVAGMAAGTETRASVLLAVAENETLSQRELSGAFVMMQYFGYLRRSPVDPPDADFTGYDFWLAKLAEFGGDYRRAEMVKAFITSIEYRARFKTPVD